MESSPDDVNCVLCGEPVPPPLDEISSLLVANFDRDWPSANRFFAHDACLRAAAHASVRARVHERLDNVITEDEIARYEAMCGASETPDD